MSGVTAPPSIPAGGTVPQVQTVQGPVDTAPARAGVTDEQIETMLVGNPRRYSEDTGTY